jgi:transcriptional regulator with XRE-family HTH domain
MISKENQYKEIAKVLRDKKAQHSLTDKELSVNTELTTATIKKVLNGQIGNLGSLLAIAAVFKMDIFDICKAVEASRPTAPLVGS